MRVTVTFFMSCYPFFFSHDYDFGILIFCYFTEGYEKIVRARTLDMFGDDERTAAETPATTGSIESMIKLSILKYTVAENSQFSNLVHLCDCR